MGRLPSVDRRRRRIETAGALLLSVVMLGGVMATPAGATPFPNTAAITIPAGAPGTTTGPAAPYPSAITASGLQGVITDVNVTLVGATHTYPDDIDVLLVGPFGQTVVLMSDTGAGFGITNLTLTFDDAAAASLPDTTQIAAGTYKPTQGVTCNTCGFNGGAPAPTGPYGTTFAGFNGTDPNGTWNLYVYDDNGGDVGSLSGGWSLDVTTNAPTVTSFTPTSGTAGTSVTITGTNFTGATAVTFGGVASTSTAVNSPTQITATVPPSAKTGPIAVTGPAGTGTSSADFTVIAVSHARRVSLAMPGAKAKGAVRVKDAFTACAAHVPVKLQRYANGKWVNVKKVKTDASGAYRIRGVTHSGKYRALAKKVKLGDTDICKKAVSKRVVN